MNYQKPADDTLIDQRDEWSEWHEQKSGSDNFQKNEVIFKNDF